jgi:hypothetical protein
MRLSFLMMRDFTKKVYLMLLSIASTERLAKRKKRLLSLWR